MLGQSDRCLLQHTMRLLPLVTESESCRLASWLAGRYLLLPQIMQNGVWARAEQLGLIQEQHGLRRQEDVTPPEHQDSRNYGR